VLGGAAGFRDRIDQALGQVESVQMFGTEGDEFFAEILQRVRIALALKFAGFFKRHSGHGSR